MSTTARNSPDDYIRVIWHLSFPTGDPLSAHRGPKPTAPARIAESLDVSRASCGEMLNRLEQRGLIERGNRKEALLTAAGRIEAMRLVRRFRIVECFAVDVLGYDLSEAGTQAKQLVDGFSDDAVQRLYRSLERPGRCPHGTPIDPDHELRESPTLTSLADLPPGTTATVVRIEADAAEVVTTLHDAGIARDATVIVQSADDRYLVAVADRPPVAVPVEALVACFVRPDGVPAVPADAACWASPADETPAI